MRILRGEYLPDAPWRPVRYSRMQFSLRFPQRDLASWAAKYKAADDDAVARIGEEVRARGYYTQLDLEVVGDWKSKRIRSHIKSNLSEEVEEITSAALGAKGERLRIEAFMILRGVSWPVASVLLHFGHAEPYPILDFRALWACSVDGPPAYDFEFWQDYTAFCRKLQQRSGLGMRDVDRALWQYSKEMQRAGAR